MNYGYGYTNLEKLAVNWTEGKKVKPIRNDSISVTFLT